MAKTFDPIVLAEPGRAIVGLTPDVAAARRWYERAKELGASGVDARLQQLK
jgi:TPR repeat protein